MTTGRAVASDPAADQRVRCSANWRSPPRATSMDCGHRGDNFGARTSKSVAGQTDGACSNLRTATPTRAAAGLEARAPDQQQALSKMMKHILRDAVKSRTTSGKSNHERNTPNNIGRGMSWNRRNSVRSGKARPMGRNVALKPGSKSVQNTSNNSHENYEKVY